MGTTVYADDTENKTEKQSQVKETDSSSLSENKKKSKLSSSPSLLGSSTPDIAPFTDVEQQIKTVHETIPGLSINLGRLNYSKNLYSISANYGKVNFDLNLVFFSTCPSNLYWRIYRKL